MVDHELIGIAAEMLRKAKHAVAFTGAGISVASGIPPFRGKDGLWNKYDPIYLEIDFFHKKPFQSWLKIKEMFYNNLIFAEPNQAHHIISKMGTRGFIESVITQNVDNLHQKAGSNPVYELHGTYKQLVCTKCTTEYDFSFADLNFLPPTCFICKGILKPDMVFFNEPVPVFTQKKSFEEAEKADVFLIIGTNAEVFPAADIPVRAKENGAKIIEINIEPTHFTNTITDVFLLGTAEEIMCKIGKRLYISE
jgi:NAD-dependent deacetylase